LSTNRHPVKSNYPPYEREHCVSRLQMFCYTAKQNENIP
jgi:hypothetical protein